MFKASRRLDETQHWMLKWKREVRNIASAYPLEPVLNNPPPSPHHMHVLLLNAENNSIQQINSRHQKDWITVAMMGPYRVIKY